MKGDSTLVCIAQLLAATLLHNAKSIHLPPALVLVKLEITCRGNTYRAFVFDLACLVELSELLAGARYNKLVAIGLLRLFNFNLIFGSSTSVLKSPI